jgi:hypothetical protein
MKSFFLILSTSAVLLTFTSCNKGVEKSGNTGSIADSDTEYLGKWKVEKVLLKQEKDILDLAANSDENASLRGKDSAFNGLKVLVAVQVVNFLRKMKEIHFSKNSMTLIFPETTNGSSTSRDEVSEVVRIDDVIKDTKNNSYVLLQKNNEKVDTARMIIDNDKAILHLKYFTVNLHR